MSVDQRDVNLKKKQEVQETLRNSNLFFAPFDPRFPNQNQTRNCWQNYVDFHHCQKVKGEDYEPCQYFLKVFRDICPIDWTNKWDDQREAGIFPAKI